MSAELEALIGFIYAMFGECPHLTLVEGDFYDEMTRRGWCYNLLTGHYER